MVFSSLGCSFSTIHLAVIAIGVITARFIIISKRQSGLTVTTTILLIILLTKFFVFIRKQFLIVNKQDVLFLTDERHTAGILTAFVDLHPQLASHRQLVVNQITPFCAGLEDNLQTLAAGGYVHEQNRPTPCPSRKEGSLVSK